MELPNSGGSRRDSIGLSLKFFTAVVLLGLYLPVVVLVIFSFNDNIVTTLPLRGFTLQWYRKALSNEELLRAAFNSLYVGVTATAITLVLGTAGAFALAIAFGSNLGAPAPGGGPIAYPAFYSYAYPEPEGFAKAPIRPAAAFYSSDLREFILPYDEVRNAKSPDDILLDFLQTTYEAEASLAKWDRATLEGLRHL